MNFYVFVCTGARITKDIRIDGHLTLLFVVTPVTQIMKQESVIVLLGKEKNEEKKIGSWSGNINIGQYLI